MKITINTDGFSITVRDETGRAISNHRISYNPACMHQAIASAEAHGEIDWEESSCAQPEWMLEEADEQDGYLQNN